MFYIYSQIFFAMSTRKQHCWSLFLIKLQAWRYATSFKRDSNTEAFLWTLQNIWEQLWKINKHTQCIQVTIKSFKHLMTSWIIEWLVEWSTWRTKLFGLKILLTQRYLGKQLSIIRSGILEKHGNTDIGVKYPYSERSLPLKTRVTLTISESSCNISFSGDKSNINFKKHVVHQNIS